MNNEKPSHTPAEIRETNLKDILDCLERIHVATWNNRGYIGSKDFDVILDNVVFVERWLKEQAEKAPHKDPYESEEYKNQIKWTRVGFQDAAGLLMQVFGPEAQKYSDFLTAYVGARMLPIEAKLCTTAKDHSAKSEEP